MFRASEATAGGLITKGRLRSSAYRHLFRDIYADATLPDDHRLRCEGAALLLPSGCVLSGRSAACVRGLPLGERDDPVLVIAPPGTRGGGSVDGIRIRRAALRPDEIRRGRIPTTVPIRTAWEIARERNLVEAVVGLDVLLRHRHVRSDVLEAFAVAHPRSRPARAIRLADGGAESLPETRLRVRLVLAGLPPPVTQFEIFRDGAFAARVDLAWPSHRTVLEYDGAWHGSNAQLRRDRRRLNKLVGGQWEVFHATATDLADDAAFAELLAELRAALERRRPR